MKQLIISIVYTLTVLLSASNVFAQTVIDYEKWTGASGCNIFVTGTNSSNPVDVPANLNGSSGTLPHLSTIGQPAYDGTNKAVSLRCFAEIDANGNTIGFKGTEYQISYTFKQGYRYDNYSRFCSNQCK
jgi:hypothetical protein